MIESAVGGAICAELATSTVPGIAQEPDPELLERWTAERAPFRAD
jgi:hypothetical protein